MAEKRASTPGQQDPPDAPRGQRELICIVARDAGVEITPATAYSTAGVDVAPLAALAAAPDITFHPLFGTALRLAAMVPGVDHAGSADAAPQDAELLADMGRCYHVEATEGRLDSLAQELAALPGVEAAYVKPAAELAKAQAPPQAKPATGKAEPVVLNDMRPRAEEAAVTADFTARQGYLGAAPAGINAQYAWTIPGGRGVGVRVIDCEWGWRFTHEDLLINQGGVVIGTASPDTNHGTAVLGEISGDVNAYGITGIAPGATVFGAAFSMSTSAVIQQAADRLGRGDIILLEIHRPGPRATGFGQQGFIAVEWWPDDYLAIRYAVNRGVIVVEAAGNGAENLDDPVYDTPAAGFPAWWRNPFRRSPLDSGAIMAGAGAPPPGTHGRDWGPDRSRLDFSNHGNCVDAQGWGREVTSTGYGDLQGGPVADLWYTDQFSGTSSASPILVGALACVQGALRGAGRVTLSPGRARQMLRSTGSPQQDAPGRPRTQRIGNRPDLRQLIPIALGQGSWFGVQFTGQLQPYQTQRWFTYNWPAHWRVVWDVIPTSLRGGGPAVEWTVRTERPTDYFVTYWIDIKNMAGEPVFFEARYAVLGW